MLRIDAHTHILPKKMPNWSEKFGYGDFIYLQHHKKGFAKMMREMVLSEIRENCWNPACGLKNTRPSIHKSRSLYDPRDVLLLGATT